LGINKLNKSHLGAQKLRHNKGPVRTINNSGNGKEKLVFVFSTFICIDNGKHLVYVHLMCCCK